MKRMSLTEFNTMFKSSMAKKSFSKKVTLDAVGKLIEDEAVSLLGHTQTEWPPLAETTEDIKLREGYALDAPLVRTGNLKYSIDHDVVFGGNEVIVGTPLPYAVDQEFGTNHIPARSFLWLAFFRQEFLVFDLIFLMLCSFIDLSNLKSIERISKYGGIRYK